MEQDGVGDRFQRDTGYVRGSIPAHRLDWGHKPDAHKEYPEAPRIELPRPDLGDGMSLWQCLAERRSVRSTGGKPLTIEEVSALVWAAQGLTARAHDVEFRTAPSAGALYPVETYLSVHRVRGLSPGIYHYNVSAHALELVRDGDMRVEVARAALDQRMVLGADVAILWTAVFERSKWKYRQRAYRYVYLDAGHIAQNVALASEALGLGSCQIAALYDDEVNAILGVDGESESAIYMTIVGRKP